MKCSKRITSENAKHFSRSLSFNISGTCLSSISQRSVSTTWGGRAVTRMKARLDTRSLLLIYMNSSGGLTSKFSQIRPETTLQSAYFLLKKLNWTYKKTVSSTGATQKWSGKSLLAFTESNRQEKRHKREKTARRLCRWAKKRRKKVRKTPTVGKFLLILIKSQKKYWTTQKLKMINN